MRVADTTTAQSELIARLRKQPQDIDSRLQLFRFAVIDGNWDRARSQLDVATKLDHELEQTALVYRHNIGCERIRCSVFQAAASPVFLGTPPAWVGYLVQALQQADHAAGATLARIALEKADVISGAIDGQPFAWLADGDCRLGPVLETFIDGKYYWIPFEHIRRIAISAPDDLLDLAWCPCELTLSNGGVCNGFIPTRYPGTDRAGRDDLKLARLTEWLPWSDTLQIGCGQRMFVSDQDEYALLDCREILFDNAPSGRPS